VGRRRLELQPSIRPALASGHLIEQRGEDRIGGVGVHVKLRGELAPLLFITEDVPGGLAGARRFLTERISRVPRAVASLRGVRRSAALQAGEGEYSTWKNLRRKAVLLLECAAFWV
jgi:hypothetical protein